MYIDTLPQVQALSVTKPHHLISTLLHDNSGSGYWDGEFFEIDVTARLQLITEHSSVTYDFGVSGLLDEEGDDLSVTNVGGGILAEIEARRAEIVGFGQSMVSFLNAALQRLEDAEKQVNHIRDSFDAEEKSA